MSINVEKYKKNPDVCPFCGSENVTAGDTDFSYINAWRNVKCNSCKKEWTEEFTITNVAESTEDL